MEKIPKEFKVEERALANYKQYKGLKSLLWNAYKEGRSEAELNKTEVASLRAIAKEKAGFASVQAASIVQFFHGNAPAFYPAVPNFKKEREEKKKER